MRFLGHVEGPGLDIRKVCRMQEPPYCTSTWPANRTARLCRDFLSLAGGTSWTKSAIVALILLPNAFIILFPIRTAANGECVQ